MFLEYVLVFGLMGLAIVLMGTVVVMALRAGPVKRSTRGVLVQIDCPAEDRLLKIRVGKDRASGELAVLWCERFPHGAVTCDRACIDAARETVALPG